MLDDFLMYHKKKIIIGTVIVFLLGAFGVFEIERHKPAVESQTQSVDMEHKDPEKASKQKHPKSYTENAQQEENADRTVSETDSEDNSSASVNTAKSDNKDDENVKIEMPRAALYADDATYVRGVEIAGEDVKTACTLTVSCEEILSHMDKLNPDKVDLVPSNGMIFSSSNVGFKDGESVFDVLQREMRENKIHMEFVNTPSTNSAYIEGINNLYEFDCGERSGWMYKVNGEYPNVGCSQYKLKPGDVVEFVYTCG